MNYWTNAPKWVNYIAVDADGQVWGFEKEPRVNQKWKAWLPVRGLSERLSLIEESADWENSLEERKTSSHE